MCGLAGILRIDGGTADATELAPMLATLAHRGPDDDGTWHDGPVAFGFRRLSILDLSDAAHQPMVSADGTSALVYNGEVYNFRELRHELEALGCQFRSGGDAEVVLQALRAWGPERAIPRFNGMFAIAFYHKASATLWLARDRLGIKPMAVARTSGEWLFASEEKALLAHPRLRRAVDEAAIGPWIVARHRRGADSLFAGVENLEPGTWWKIAGTGVERHCYHSPFIALDVARLAAAAAAPPETHVAMLREALVRSVAMHLVSDAPIATACSGGLDSGLVTAYGRGHTPSGIPAYVADIRYEGSERGRAERACRHLGVALRPVAVTREDYLRRWPLVVWHLDRPSTLASDPALLALTQACRADGIKVLLTGEGSDELFGGYSWQRGTYKLWRKPESWWWPLLPRGAQRRARHRGDPAEVFHMGVLRPGQMRGRLLALDPGQDLLPQRLMDHLATITPASDRAFLARCLYDLHTHLSRILQRHDRMGMAASIETRVPFLENDLIDLAWHLPRRAKLHRGKSKWVIRQLAEDLLPRDLVDLPKLGFPAPLSFTAGTERLLLGGRVPDQLRWSRADCDAMVGRLAQSRLLRFELVGLELWLRLFFDGERAEALGERLMALAA